MFQSMTVWPCAASSRAKVLGRGRRRQDRTQRPRAWRPRRDDASCSTFSQRLKQELRPTGPVLSTVAASCLLRDDARGSDCWNRSQPESGLRRPLVLPGSRLPEPGMAPTDFQGQRSKPSGRNGIVGALTDSQSRLWRVYCVAAVMHAVLAIRPTRVDGSGGAGRLSASRKRPAS